MMSRVYVFCCVSLVALLGAGCGLFERRDVAYQESRSQPPLQVPDGLDRPPMDDALYIPELPTPGSRREGVEAAGAGSQWTGDSLLLADSLASTWRRTGLALTRIPEISILDTDESAGLYRVQASATRPVTGFFRRLIKREEKVVETFELRLEAEGAGTRIRTVGGGDVARALLQRLQDRLG
jgi:uncharacterized lipoprotein